MTLQETRGGSDRTLHYTMKTSRPTPVSSQSSHSHSRSHSHANSHSHSHRASKSGTPLASPRLPYSVGQPHPPKLSPNAVARVAAQAQDVRTPSPNYFGLIVEPATDPRDSAVVPRTNWSPPSSSVKSFAAALPQQLPLDANPEFEAFRRQADANRGGFGLSLGASGFGRGGAPGTPLPSAAAAIGGALSGNGALKRPRPPRWHTYGSDTPSEASTSTRLSALAPPATRIRDSSTTRMDTDADCNSLHDSAYVSADSKRNSEVSLNPPGSFLNLPRYESPAQFESPFETRLSVSNNEDRHPRLSVMQGKAEPPTAAQGHLKSSVRADTVPTKLDAAGPGMMSPSELKDILESPAAADELLLLDVRVSTHYSTARIHGALNLCIPTTLLKRATFNLHKLQTTFQSEEQQQQFAAWHEKQYLVVYDSSSTEKRDAVAALNMLKKFTNEGYGGEACVLRGGYAGFAAAFPQLIDRGPAAQSSSAPPLSLGSDASRRPTIAPVIGGVVLPASSSNPNPFFSNIRQNMDLADGVGQMDVALPANVDMAALPAWLRTAASTGNKGKKVSDQFLHIEQAEQERMKNAYSLINPSAESGKDAGNNNIQLSGIEKGGKNRYKDILPFEHARVVLEGRPQGACDYVNASHVKASRSRKRYIASQGPLPATFEDFWSMVWDQDVRVVVMLTAESEGGQLKCHPYWTGKEFGPIKLRSISEKKVSLDIDKHRSHSAMTSISTDSDSPTPRSVPSAGDVGRRRANTTTTLEGSTPTPVQPRVSPGNTGETPYVIIRKFALSHNAHPFAPIREITHLHYPSWPDFGAPAQPSHLLALVELANVMQRAALPLDASGAFPSAAAAASSDRAPASRSSTSSSSGGGDRSMPALTWYDEPEADAAARPMLVHCSAGCGRTGTFCTVDSVIDMLKRQRMWAVKKANAKIEARERELRLERRRQELMIDDEGDVSMDDEPGPFDVSTNPAAAAAAAGSSEEDIVAFPSYRDTSDHHHHQPYPTPSEPEDLNTDWLHDDSIDLIAKTVEDFRGQRLSMVQSLRQFVLCYETITEWIWRLQERSGVSTSGGGSRGRARSGSLQVQRTE